MQKILKVFHQWLKQSDREKKTIDFYIEDVSFFLNWAKLRNQEIKKAEDLTSELFKEYKKFLVKKYSPYTTNRKINSVRIFVAWLNQTDRLPYFVHVPKSEKIQEHAPRWLTKNEVNKLLRYVNNDCSKIKKVIILLFLNTGLRVSELGLLMWKDIKINDKKGSLTIRGKGGKTRTVPLNNIARKALLEIAPNNMASNLPLFPSKNGFLNRGGIQYHAAYCLKRAGLTHRIHDLRHTFAKRLLDNGVPLTEVATLMGHSKIETTRKYLTPSLVELQISVETLD